MLVEMILDVRQMEAYARNTLVGLINATVLPRPIIEYVVACCHTLHEGIPIHDILTAYDNFDGEDFQHDANIIYELINKLKSMYYHILATDGNVLDRDGVPISTYQYSHCLLQGITLRVYLHKPLPPIIQTLTSRSDHV